MNYKVYSLFKNQPYVTQDIHKWAVPHKNPKYMEAANNHHKYTIMPYTYIVLGVHTMTTRQIISTQIWSCWHQNDKLHLSIYIFRQIEKIESNDIYKIRAIYLLPISIRYTIQRSIAGRRKSDWRNREKEAANRALYRVSFYYRRTNLGFTDLFVYKLTGNSIK